MSLVATKADQGKTHDMLREVVGLLHSISGRLSIPASKTMAISDGAAYSTSPSNSRSRHGSPSKGRSMTPSRAPQNEFQAGLTRVYHRNKKMLMVRRSLELLFCALHAGVEFLSYIFNPQHLSTPAQTQSTYNDTVIICGLPTIVPNTKLLSRLYV